MFTGLQVKIKHVYVHVHVCVHTYMYIAHDKCCDVQLLQVGLEVGGAMAYLHPQVVHRDLKSQNVVFGQSKAKVCDFGIAKFKER